MSVYLNRIDINLIAAVVLSAVVYIADRCLDKHDLINRAFLLVSKIVIFLLLIEAATCVINTRPEIWLIPVSIIAHICLFVGGSVLAYYWHYLTCKVVPGSKTGNKLRETLLLFPLWRICFCRYFHGL
jgi:hypothetical protein